VEKVCPRCGAKSSEKKFVENFCLDCFKNYIDLDTPAAVDLLVCRSCDRVKLGAGWQEKNAKAIGEFVLRQCNVGYDTAKARVSEEGECEISFAIKAGDSTIEVNEHIGIRYSPTLCDRCSRESSGYFEAIIQVRGSEENVERARGRLVPELERSSFISKTKKGKRGIDIYVGSKQVAGEALSKLGLKPKISNKLHGVKDGQRIYRTTFSIRV